MSRLLTALVALAVVGPACSQTPVLVPLRSMERPKDVDFICMKQENGAWRGTALEECAPVADDKPNAAGARLYSVVTQVSRGELAVIDLGQLRSDVATLVKVDPRVPGYSFIPVGAAPTDVVADPLGKVVFVSSGRDPRIDVIPSGILLGPIDTKAAVDPPPWPHIAFDRKNDGMPTAMSIVRNGDQRRLYVTLPEAKPSAKIAVFDVGGKDDVAPLPARVGDILLGAPAAQPLPWAPISCAPYTADRSTWWAAYDACVGEKPKIPVGVNTVDPAITDFHLAGVAAVGNYLFVADDRAPVVHVYDAIGGLEIRRIAIGSPTARLAVSPIVPDEVTFQNAAAIDVCTARGWIGDGKDHSAESPTVAEQLKGRCRAHRYVYAVDLVNSEASNGSIAVVDVPVIVSGTTERLDIDGSELVQPMACDAPTFPARRIPLGPFGLNGTNVVPARNIAFVKVDTVSPKVGLQAVRCRGWDINPTKRFQHPLSPRDLDPADGITPDERDKRRSVGEARRVDVDPKRLRGVFAWVALANGAVIVVDVDDYDATCRGPTALGDKDAQNGAVARGAVFKRDDEKTFALLRDNPNVPLSEYYPTPVRRHHPRALRLFTTDLAPVMSLSSLTRFDTVLSNDPTTETGRANPHFAALKDLTPTDTRPTTLLPAPDNPYAFSTEGWAATYEGVIPGFSGTFGALSDEGGQLTFTDPSAGFCRKGVESDGDTARHDVVQLVDEVCAFSRCTDAEKQKCLETFGETTAAPLSRNRSLIIDKAFEGKLTLANKHFRATGPDDSTIVDGPPDMNLIRTCFGDSANGKRVLPLLRYTVRGSKAWIVVGGTSGFLHRKIADRASAEKACITDLNQPRIVNGRVLELPAFDKDALFKAPYVGDAVVKNQCDRFMNMTLQFAIRAGTEPSRQDMRFTIGVRFAWQPFSIGAGSLAASIKPVSSWVDGVDKLNFRMIAVVDAIDRGLLVFPTDEPFTFQKGIN